MPVSTANDIAVPAGSLTIPEVGQQLPNIYIPIHCLSIADSLDLQHAQDVVVKIGSHTSPHGEIMVCKRGNSTCCVSGTPLSS